MKTVCLINPPYNAFMETLDAPFNLMYLGAIAENCGWQAKIVDMKEDDDYIPEATIYGVTSTSPQWYNTVNLSKRLAREHPDSMKIVGGPHISAEPQNLGDTMFNLAVLGEGEIALQGLLDNFTCFDPLNSMRVIWGAPVKDLDSVPFPARHLVDWSKYKRGIFVGKRMVAEAVSIISSRGCPFHCIFCGSNIIFGRRTRFRSIYNVVAEIKHVIKTMGYRGFNFHDDTFCLNKKRVIDMAREFAKLDIVWRCLSRADTVDEQVLNAMYDSGCRELILGVESGSQKILDTLQKGTTVKQNLKAMKLIKRSHIQLKVGIIVGSPGETWETVRETEKLLKKCPPDFWNVSVFTPYPGSMVWKEPDRYRLKILTRDLREYAMVGKEFRGNVVVETEHMRKKDIEEARDELIDLCQQLSPQGET
jgi:anaerobic magnesium-protoporphyrin IX monomethyl ester cyclase